MNNDAETVVADCIVSFFRNTSRVNGVVVCWHKWIELDLEERALLWFGNITIPSLVSQCNWARLSNQSIVLVCPVLLPRTSFHRSGEHGHRPHTCVPAPPNNSLKRTQPQWAIMYGVSVGYHVRSRCVAPLSSQLLSGQNRHSGFLHIPRKSAFSRLL